MIALVFVQYGVRVWGEANRSILDGHYSLMKGRILRTFTQCPLPSAGHRIDVCRASVFTINWEHLVGSKRRQQTEKDVNNPLKIASEQRSSQLQWVSCL